ncbi:Ca2+-binding RTX toxin-like protein [Microvirga flocculans]|uniref:Ca2+-binding RTX toxin-like protein n=1 Tax=Microvirga flocculans TaxID=217168 RepID=A0A7W6ICB2_9HYPH|nr:calcium-binding protein [Microvirga flocculans]MBB4038784.1 Ca2+-binding RTX toxin-like protein [Microvirga flocculans]
MAKTLDTWKFDGDYHRIVEGGGPTPLDWGGDAEVISGYGILDVQVGLWGAADVLHERLGIMPGMGVTLSNGFEVGSEVSINGYPAIVMPGGSGTYNFHIMFPEPGDPTRYRGAPPEIVQTFLRALTYQNTAETIPDDFSRLVSVILSNDGDGTTGHDFEQEFVTFSKWLPRHGPDTGGPGDDDPGGGGNLPPSIGGNLNRGAISDSGFPFAQMTVSDANNDILTASIGIGEPRWGYFLASSLSGGTYNAQTGIYTISGTPAFVQAAIQKLVFVAAPRPESAPASLSSIFFNVTVSDGTASTSVRLDANLWTNRADVIKGKSTSEKLYGHSGKDKLYGNGGNDKLYGGSGSDSLNGGSGKDAFVFDTKPNAKTNRDAIADFKVKDDSFWLDNAVFTKLGKSGSEKKPAQLKKDFFTIGSKAKDKNDYVIYDDKKGKLYYDADGSGSKYKQVEIATLSKKLAMTYKDFFVI